MATETVFYLLACAVVIAWIVSVVVYAFALWLSDRNMVKLMRGFAARFPDRCFFCALHRHVYMELPPPHDCRKWTASSEGNDHDVP